MSETQETNPVQDLIQYSLDQDFNKAGKAFGEIMTVKLNDLLDQEKIKVSNQIYNGVEDGPEEPEEGEQLDFDLDNGDEEIPDESSEDQGDDEEDAGTNNETEDEFEETEEEEE